MIIVLNPADRTILNALAGALVAANNDHFHSFQDRTFGHITVTIVATVADIVSERSNGEDELQLASFSAAFFASWGGEEDIGDLVEELLNQATYAHR